MSEDIHDDPRYKELKDQLDTAIRSHAQYVNAYANEHDDGGTGDDHLMVTGWILSIAVMGVNDEGEFDDTLQEANPGMNNFMALGISTVTTKYLKDQAMGIHYDEDDE